MKARKAGGRSRKLVLGTLSGDTRGDFGPHWEASGLQRNAGLTND